MHIIYHQNWIILLLLLVLGFISEKLYTDTDSTRKCFQERLAKRRFNKTCYYLEWFLAFKVNFTSWYQLWGCAWVMLPRKYLQVVTFFRNLDNIFPAILLVSFELFSMSHNSRANPLAWPWYCSHAYFISSFILLIFTCNFHLLVKLMFISRLHNLNLLFAPFFYFNLIIIKKRGNHDKLIVLRRIPSIAAMPPGLIQFQAKLASTLANSRTLSRNKNEK